MRGFMYRLMNGRYGSDQLNILLFVLALVLSLVSGIAGVPNLQYASYILLIIAIWRIMSRNVTRRRRENAVFMRVLAPVKLHFRKTGSRIRDRKTHKYITCPACRKTLRVPRGRGKIRITCPKCGERFTRDV